MLWEGGNTSQQPIGNTRVRRNWTELEKEILLTILEEMVVADRKRREWDIQVWHSWSSL